MPHPRWPELDELVIWSSDPTEVLQIATLDEIAEAWCTTVAQDEKDDEDPDFWAWSFFSMTGLFEGDRQLHRDAIEALLRRAGDDRDLLGAIGAGPLEDFLPQLEEDFRWLERLALELPGTRIAVGTMWVGDELTAWQMERLDQIADKPLTR